MTGETRVDSRPGYLGELRAQVRPLAAATIGIAFGMSINNYTSSLFGAQLVAEFGWDRADFALIGIFAIVLVPLFPIIGRLTDVHGVRWSATIGVIGTPLTFFMQAWLNTGDIAVFFAINFLQLLTGAFLTSTVFNRVVAERFTLARGIAFAIIMSGPPVAGGLAAWALGPVTAEWGWRGGYAMMGAIVAIFGVLALVLLPAHNPPRTQRPGTLRRDFGTIARHPVFWLASAGMLLCNLPQALGSSQLMLMLQERGVALTASIYVALYPAGVVVGRFVTGFALDRFPTHIVGAIGLALPAIGFAVLASGADAPLVLGAAVLLMGLAQGAEGDVAAYAVARHFPVAIFASAMGPVNAATAAGAALGSLALRPMLQTWGNFTPFLVFSAVVTVIGAFTLLAMGLYSERRAEPEEIHD